VSCGAASNLQKCWRFEQSKDFKVAPLNNAKMPADGSAESFYFAVLASKI
jgi:hypothetical protein